MVPADQTNNEGDKPTLTIRASDYYRNCCTVITYGATGLPAGLSINSSTGKISGTVAAGDAAQSPYGVHLYASDGTYTDDESFTWNIGGAITITDPGDQTSNEGARADLQIQASDTISDANMTYAIPGSRQA